MTRKRIDTGLTWSATQEAAHQEAPAGARRHKPRTQQAKNQAAVKLLRQWIKEGPVCDDATWRDFKRTIEASRLSDRERFSD